MAIQTELFEDKNTQILLRCKESFKNEVKALAKDNQLNYETIQVIFAFGMYTIALISLVVKLLKNDKKK
jgi:hypothetical protein